MSAMQKRHGVARLLRMDHSQNQEDLHLLKSRALVLKQHLLS
jgi:hypothetical protein